MINIHKAVRYERFEDDLSVQQLIPINFFFDLKMKVPQFTKIQTTLIYSVIE